MILYFDSYITDIPLPGRDRSLLKEDIRLKAHAYTMPRKIDIAKYSLASYAMIPWSYVLIRYRVDDAKQRADLDTYIHELFPKAHILHTRSDTQKEYKKSLSILRNVRDNWVFYAPNNDHPLMSPDENIAAYLQSLIKKAEKLRKKHQYVSIMYSHFSEFLNIPIKGTPEHLLHGKGTKIIEEDEHACVYKVPQGDFSSVQIVHKDLLKKWFTSKELGTRRIIRAEDVRNSISVRNQVIVAPKREVCAHFDGYEHLLGQPIEIQPDQIPPLFIPKGFFTNDIKIAYGYEQYRKGWVNINPCAKKYSFRDPQKGADLKMTLEEMPLFWRSRIKKIDANKKRHDKMLQKCSKKVTFTKLHPWYVKTQGVSMRTAAYWIRYITFRTNIYIRMKVSRLLKQYKIR